MKLSVFGLVLCIALASCYEKHAPKRSTLKCEGVRYFADEHICCGGSLWSVRTYKCYHGKAVKVVPEVVATARPTQTCNAVNYFADEHICCGNELFSVLSYVCVHGKAVSTEKSKPFHPKNIRYHDEDVYQQRKSYGQQTLYKRTTTQAPTTTPEPVTTPEPRPTEECNGVNYFADEHICCGGKLFSVRTYKCVYGVAQKKHVKSYYKPTTTQAPATTPEPRPTKDCKGVNYFEEEHICCGGRLFSVRTYKCVYGVAQKKHAKSYYKPTTTQAPATTPEPRPTKDCEGVNYFEEEHICCGGKLFSVRTYKCVYGVAQKKHAKSYYKPTTTQAPTTTSEPTTQAPKGYYGQVQQVRHNEDAAYYYRRPDYHRRSYYHRGYPRYHN